MAAIDGARRTGTVLDRVSVATKQPDVAVLPSKFGFNWKPIEKLPEVKALGLFGVTYVLGATDKRYQGLSGFPPVGRSIFRDVDVQRVDQGRLPDPNKPARGLGQRGGSEVPPRPHRPEVPGRRAEHAAVEGDLQRWPPHRQGTDHVGPHRRGVGPRRPVGPLHRRVGPGRRPVQHRHGLQPGPGRALSLRLRGQRAGGSAPRLGRPAQVPARHRTRHPHHHRSDPRSVPGPGPVRAQPDHRADGPCCSSPWPSLRPGGVAGSGLGPAGPSVGRRTP